MDPLQKQFIINPSNLTHISYYFTFPRYGTMILESSDLWPHRIAPVQFIASAQFSFESKTNNNRPELKISRRNRVHTKYAKSWGRAWFMVMELLVFSFILLFEKKRFYCKSQVKQTSLHLVCSHNITLEECWWVLYLLNAQVC